MDLDLAGEGKSGRRGMRGQGGRPAMKGNTCIPRLGRGSRAASSPVSSMLERFREAVFRLIMLSAISKGNGRGGGGTGSSYSCSAVLRANYSQESHYGEAMADCIDFIKKSSMSSSEDGGQDSVAGDIVEVRPETLPAV